MDRSSSGLSVAETIGKNRCLVPIEFSSARPDLLLPDRRTQRSASGRVYPGVARPYSRSSSGGRARRRRHARRHGRLTLHPVGVGVGWLAAFLIVGGMFVWLRQRAPSGVGVSPAAAMSSIRPPTHRRNINERNQRRILISSGAPALRAASVLFSKTHGPNAIRHSRGADAPAPRAHRHQAPRQYHQGQAAWR